MQPLFGMFLDVGLPMISFYLLRLVGTSQWSALLAATAIAGARVGWVALRSRRVSWFAALMMSVYGLGLVLAVFTGDPRLLLANNSLSSVIVGVAFLISLPLDRPLTLIAYQSWRPGDAYAWSAAYSSNPLVKRTFRVGAWAWGAGMLAAGALRLPLIYLLPLDVAVAASAVPGLVIMGGLSAWSIASMRPLTAADAA
ncbi:hypothetical protein A5787_23585 [Mycobacterium sp. 852002-50816_SCH5313054-b]|nr:hypothetical protein A5787_23585 [Mycobacterium sp. 852002-50816_SCH5313054-b]